ncbi:MAG: phosphotransferase family protein [Alphaproteobacteria bacterium]|nr:phosphotransferase family protein [Alphaproteobacteria bacterium]
MDLIARLPALHDWVRAATGADAVSLTGARRLSGGAIQENWAVDLDSEGGSLDGRHALVLRGDAPSGVAVSRSRAEEFALLEVAFAAGVTVPEPLLLCVDARVVGVPFYLMRRASGTAAAFRMVKDPAVAAKADALAERLGEELARIHAIRPDDPAMRARLAFLGEPPANAALARVAEYRAHLDALPTAHPVLEWGLRWLERHAPPQVPATLCHGDFRTGNYMVDDGQLTALLDWEFASWSDPMEDLGYICAKAWRFGATGKRLGGIAPLDPFKRGYARVAPAGLPWGQLDYWEIMGTVRWGLVAVQQGERHISGGQASLELALTGRMVAEMEQDLLLQIARVDAAAGGS